MTSWWKAPEKLYTAKEFAELIGWPHRTVQSYIKKKNIRSIRRGKRQYLIREKELVRWGLLEEEESS